MKRILTCLAPWMVMIAVGQSSSLRPASVQFTHYKESPAYRTNDEAWVSPNVLVHWGMPYRIVSNDVTISAEGRTLKVVGKVIDGKFLLPLTEIFNQLGVVSSWRSDRDTLVGLSQARLVSVRDGKIQIDTTTEALPAVSFMETPSRLIVDMKGVRLGDAKIDMDGTARVGQYTPDTVRLVIMTNDRPQLPNANPTRSLRLNITPVPEPAPTNPPANQTQVQPDPLTPPISNQPTARVGPFALVSETNTRAQLSIPIATPQGAPKFSRIDPTTLQLVVPKGTYVPPAAPLGSPSISAVEPTTVGDELRIQIRLSRPMGVEFSTGAGGYTINLVKPSVGNGTLAGKTVVVDPGHGGNDPGANNGGVQEKDVVLNVSKLVANELLAEGATVIMTRKTDTFIKLTERPEIANRNGADFFISIHINSNKVANSASGSISFFHGGRPMGELLASCIENELKRVSGLPSMGVWSDRRIYNSGFAVLRLAKMPAVLLELGFVNNNRDRARLATAEYQAVAARAIVKGIKVYLGDAKS
jgi:N-acetylmuramoyl-L-alanine amidase